MSSFFNRMRAGAGTSQTSPSKKDANTPQLTPLERQLLDAGPIREDGKDKFWGLENFGNTCYCNSILQCLYYSVPFREQVINFPKPTSAAAVTSAPDGKTRLDIDAVALPLTHPSLSYAKLMNKPNAQSATARNSGAPPTNPKPEDKEQPDFKKRVALARGPNIAMNYENAASYEMEESLFTALKDMFEAIYVHTSRTGVVSPTRFLEVLKREHEMFRSAMHQDAHEFLNLLLNEVTNQIEAYAAKLEAKTKGIQGNGSANGSATGGFERALARARSQLPNNTSWVHELFEGTLTSETKCLTCENVSQRDEVFLDLSVDLEEHGSVTSCLRKFSEEEMLCERNKFHCDGCGGLQEAEKRMKIKRLPKILALHLKRFKYTEDLNKLHKLFHRVVYPYDLRLFNTTDDAEDPDRLYELYAVVVHIGGGPHHGHYISIIKTRERGWLLFDDEMVEPVDKSYVQNFFGDRPGLACAYVLFYQETTHENMKREQDAEGLATSQKSVVEIPKENTGMGLRASGTANGIHPVRSAISPAGPEEGFNHLDKAVTAPQQSPVASREVTALPLMPTSVAPAEAIKSKKERAKEEKERKTRAKEEAKEVEKEERERRKTIELNYKTALKDEDAKIKSASEASRQSKLDEDSKRIQQEPSSNGVYLQPTSAPATGLSRLKSTSKSFRKPKFFGGSKDGAKADQSRPIEETPLDTPLDANNNTHLGGGATAAAIAAMSNQPLAANGVPLKSKTNRFSSLRKKTSALKL